VVACRGQVEGKEGSEWHRMQYNLLSVCLRFSTLLFPLTAPFRCATFRWSLAARKAFTVVMSLQNFDIWIWRELESLIIY
jgi:hypothetical protein